ncbi:hypothetical protein DIURU_001004 [Diutina rugosa]|uniref:Sister chromatid cohesion protein n=1 Tax=Diutina rugosa TaxID=5481 RepID=A0A642UW96_DIURU|nr:uncharacterized protein DIURU_001004 [Diutina rugosa]KAA8906595.1 hypothetical protein DIURU_001004 [Diutina rugosa]
MVVAELKRLLPEIPQTRLIPSENIVDFLEPRELWAKPGLSEVLVDPSCIRQLSENQKEYGDIWQEMLDEINTVDLPNEVTIEKITSGDSSQEVSPFLAYLMEHTKAPDLNLVEAKPIPFGAPLDINQFHSETKKRATAYPTPPPSKRPRKSDIVPSPKKPFKIRDGDDSIEYLQKLNRHIALQEFDLADLQRILKNCEAIINETTDWENVAAAAQVITTVLSNNLDKVVLHVDKWYEAVMSVIKTGIYDSGDYETSAKLLHEVPSQSENAVTLEYFCFDVIFGDFTHEGLRHAATSLLVNLFHRFEDQREFILEMVAKRADIGGKLKLARGGTVSLTTALFVMMIQTRSNIAELGAFVCSQLPSMTHFMDDLLILLDLPEWPGAEQMVASVITHIGTMVVGSEEIDILGKFCLKWAETHSIVGRLDAIEPSVNGLRGYLREFGKSNPRYADVYQYHEETESPIKRLDEYLAKSTWQRVWVTRLQGVYVEASSILIHTPGARLQAKAVRTLTQLLEHDRHLVSAVSAAFPGYKDAAVTMRDALLDLVSKLLQLGAKFDDFAKVLAQFLDDDSALVKKRTLKVIVDLWDQTAPQLQTLLVYKLVQHAVNDEDVGFREKAGQVVSLKLSGDIMMSLVKLPASMDVEHFVVAYFKLFPPQEEMVQAIVEQAEREQSEEPLASLVLISEVRSLGQDQLSVLQSILGTSLAALRILRRSLTTTTLRPETAKVFYEKLITGLGQFSVTQLEEAVPALVLLARRDKKTHLGRFVKSTISQVNQLTRDPSNPQKLAKLCRLLGLFIHYGDWESLREVAVPQAPQSESVVSFICRLFMAVISNSNSDEVKDAAVNGLLEVCSTHPSLFKNPRIKRVIKQCFENPALVVTITSKLLLVIGGSIDEKTPSFALDHKSVEIAPMVVDEYFDHVRSMMYSSAACARFVYAVMEQGLTLPSRCIGPSIALMAHHDPEFRSIASRGFALAVAKHASLIDFEDGLRQGFDYAGPTANYIGYVHQQLALATAAVSTGSKQIHNRLTRKLFEAVTRMLDDDTLVDTIARNLVDMSFSTAAEVLMVVKSIEDELTGPGQDALNEAQDDEDVTEETMNKYLVMVELLRTLMTNYGITEDELESFNPKKISKKSGRVVTKSDLRQFNPPAVTKEKFIEELDTF